MQINLIMTLLALLLSSACEQARNQQSSQTDSSSVTREETTSQIKYLDADPLPAPPKNDLDELTKAKIKEIQDSGRSNFKLCIGCQNDEAHRKRFGNDLKDWVFLDIAGFNKGQPFLHMDFGNKSTLRLIAEDGPYSLKGRFNEIAFDFSVARGSDDFKGRHVALVKDLLGENGKLYMWPDERPFEDEPNQTLTDNFKTKPNFCEDTLRKEIKVLDSRNANFESVARTGYQDPKDIVTITLNLFNQPYAKSIEASQSNNPQCIALFNEYEKKKVQQLKLALRLINLVLDLKHGDYPIPGDSPYLKNVDYFELIKSP